MNEVKKYVFLEIDYTSSHKPVLRTVVAELKIELGLRLKIVEDRSFALNSETKEDIDDSVKQALGDELDVCLLRTGGVFTDFLPSTVRDAVSKLPVRMLIILQPTISPRELFEILVREVASNENIEISASCEAINAAKQKLKTTETMGHEGLICLRAVLNLTQMVVLDLDIQFDIDSGSSLRAKAERKKGGV